MDFKPLDRYIDKHQFDPELEIAYGRREKDDRIVEKLAAPHLPLAISFAHSYSRRGYHDLEQDLEQVAMMALYEAAWKYDGRGKFTSYAMWFVRKNIFNCINDAGRTVRVPRNVYSILRKSRRLFDAEIAKGKNRSEARAVIAGRIKNEAIVEMVVSGTGIQSLDALAYSDGTQTRLDNLADSGPGPVRRLFRGIRNEDLAIALQRVEERGEPHSRYIRVIRKYYNLDGDGDFTLKRIGSMLGLTEDRVRQLRNKGLRALRPILEEMGYDRAAA